MNIMLYILKIDDYLETLTDEEVEDFIHIGFSEYLKSVIEEQNLRKVAKSLYIFLTTPAEAEKYVQSNSSDNCIHRYNVKILNIFDPQLELIKTYPMIINRLKELLSELKTFKVYATIILDYNKRSDFA